MRYLFISLLFLTFGCNQRTDQKIHEEIDLSWELITNVDPMGSKARFTFYNKGDYRIDQENWTLYFNQNNVIPKSQNNPFAKVEHINGDLFCLKPGESFAIDPGDSLQITYFYEGPMIKNTDAPIGLYFVYDEDTEKERIASVRSYHLIEFERPEQIHRAEKDFMPIPTPESVYESNRVIKELDFEAVSKIIPSPFEAELSTKTLVFDHAINLAFDAEFEKEVRYLENRLNSYFVHGVKAQAENIANIKLLRQPAKFQNKSDDAYDLIVNEYGIEIKAQEASGIFYGIQSLLSLQQEPPVKKEVTQISFPHATIFDYPRFGYRGFQLDVGRNFQTKETIKKLIDLLANYKINTFLFYLTEDEGWRLEIEGLPELTEVGGQRQHATPQDQALHPSYGSGPVAYAEGTFGSGFYSKEDFIEILRYAHQRHIQVIPEVNLPGHARAAIKAMERRYSNYMKKGEPVEAERYRLIDPEDKSEYMSAQSFKDNVVCVCRESVYDFYEKVIDVIVAYYAEAGVPLEYFHVGGDEVPQGPWTNSPLCEKLLKSEKEISGPENLHAYFFERAVSILKKRNLKIAGWEEVALKKVNGENEVNPEFADGSVVPYVWNTLWGAQDLGYQMANRGYPVVLCPVTNFYFDLAYNKDPLEPGLYWAGFVNARNAYQYAPFDVFKTTERDDSYYTPIDTEKAFSGMERLEESAKENILGVQAQLWSETIKGREMMEYYLLPKLLGFAESAWSREREWESISDKAAREEIADKGWNEMANRIGKSEFNKLDHMFGGFAYRIPPPGAVVRRQTLLANNAYPGLTIRYTTDGSEPGPSSQKYEGPVEIDPGITVKLKAFNQIGRVSRTTVLKQLK